MQLPPYLLQAAPGQETDACTAFSLCNLIYMKTGWLPSMRALAIDAKLQLSQNDNVSAVLNAANNIGLAGYNDCPIPDPLTDELFYNFDTSKLRKQKLNIRIVTPVYPIWTELEWGQNLAVPTRHMVVMIDSQDFVDSEAGGQIKNINKPTIYGGPPASIQWQGSITINKPFMNETVIALSKDGKTVYKCTPVATDWDNFVKQCGVEGITIPATLPPTSSL